MRCNLVLISRQSHEKYLAGEKDLHSSFKDLEQASDRLPRILVWCALRKLGVEEWLVRIVQRICRNSPS